jgi:hypothetical protein
MAWAALGKAAMGAVKAGAKKVATDKLLNRKKKTASRRASAQKIMGQDSGAGEEKGGSIVKAQISPLPLARSTEAIGKTPAAGGGEGGGSGEIEGTLMRIKTTVISVDTLLKGSYTLQQKQLEQQRAAAEKAEDAAAEGDLEKKKKKGPNIGKLVPKQVKSLWTKLLDFFTGIILGWVVLRLDDLLPALQKAIPKIAAFGEFLANTAVWIVNVLGTFVDGSYKFVNFMQGMVKNAFGEEGAKKFGIFMNNLKNLVAGFLVWKIIGQKIFETVLRNIKVVWAVAKSVIQFAAKTINSMSGGAIGNFAKKGISAIGSKIAKSGGGKLGSSILKHGAGRALKRTSIKFLGKGATAKLSLISKPLSKIPIIGPIITAVISLMSGEPLSQALFKAFGAALGGFLGVTAGTALTAAATGVTGPLGIILGKVLLPGMTIFGELVGVFLGDMMYQLILGGGLSSVAGKLKDLFGNVVDKIKEGAGSMITFFKEGMTRLIDDFPTIPIPDFRPASIFAGIIEKVPGGEKLLNFTIPKWVPLIGGMGIGGILEGLPGLQEVLGFFAKFIPGLGNYVEGGKLTKIPNLFLLTPPGVPFLVPHVANSFLPGTFPAAGDPPQPASESEPPMKSAKEAKEEEKEKKKEEAKQKREEIKAKIGGVVGKVGGLFKNIGKGIMDIGKGITDIGGSEKREEKREELKASLRTGILGGLFKKGDKDVGQKEEKGKKEEKEKKREELKASLRTGILGGLFKNIGGKGKGKGVGKFESSDGKKFKTEGMKNRYEKHLAKENMFKDLSKQADEASFSDVAAGADKAKNSAGIGQLEQFAFYENTDSDVTTIIKEVPILVGGGASPAENNKPVMAGGSGGGGSNPFAALYRGDG